MQRQQEAYRKNGLAVAAVSYDSPALLRDFARRKGITYPLLGDADSTIIRAFDILNTNFHPGEMPYGVPFPGMYLIDVNGIVRAKYFEDDHTERYTAASILVREFGGTAGQAGPTVETPQLTLTSSASDAAVPPGARLTLLLDVDLKPGMHLYAPGVEGGYIPVDWQVSPTPERAPKAWLVRPVNYPPSEQLHLAAIGETVPVYRGRLRLMRDLTLGGSQDLRPLLGPDRTLTVAGSFRYQACDDRMCYAPRTLPLKWIFHIERLDAQRSPEDLRRQ